MRIGIIGKGAIGSYVRRKLLERGYSVRAILQRQDVSEGRASEVDGLVCVSTVAELPDDIDHVIDCAGHQALQIHGPEILRRGMDLTTVSIGALADDALHRSLLQAAADGNSRLHLASGAIGALDCLRAARMGQLTNVTYTGRKPPRSWKGSPAESRLDLDRLEGAAETHFDGSARQAAVDYPQNANVAAAVALSGIGFDDTRVRLIADPNIAENIHAIEASGDFGQFSFEIRGRSLPDNPKSSALAAMSVLAQLEQQTRRMSF